MPHSSYPTADDLKQRLTGAGIEEEKIAMLEEAGSLSDAVLAAVGEWESATGWTPYLAGAASVKTFDAPHAMSGGVPNPTTRLALGAPLLSLTSVVVNGAPFLQGREFVLGPQNAAAEGKPYQWIIFSAPVGTNAGSIQITGQWGKVAEIPDNVWDAILQKAQTLIAGDLSLALTGGVTEMKVDVFTLKFSGAGSDGPMDLQTKLWERRWTRLVENEKRVTY